MLKLKLAWNKIQDKLITNAIKSKHNLYHDLVNMDQKKNSQEQLRKNQAGNHRHQQLLLAGGVGQSSLITEISLSSQQLQQQNQQFRISSSTNKNISGNGNNSNKNNTSLSSQRVLNKQFRKHNIVIQSSIRQQRQEHLLLSRKKKLLTQLNQINLQLKNRHEQSRLTINRSKSPLSNQQNSRQMAQKAQQLVKRMNKQRKQQSLRRKRSIQQLNQSISKSIQQFHQGMRREEEMKEVKRRQIQMRIDRRKIQAIERGVRVEVGESVIRQIMGKSGWGVEKEGDGVGVGEDFSGLRMKSEQFQNQYQSPTTVNPQTYTSSLSTKLPYIPKIRTQLSKYSLHSSSYKKSSLYPKSSFLQKVLKQQQNIKKLQQMKSIQKKRVNMKKKEYAEKMRVRGVGKGRIGRDNGIGGRDEGVFLT